MTATFTTIPRAALTMLVLPAQQLSAGDITQAYPIDLDQHAEAIDAELHAVSVLEGAPDEIVIAGIEFGDPEQYNTTVTITGSDLDQVAWVLGDGGMVLESTAGVLAAIDHLGSVEVPVYA